MKVGAMRAQDIIKQTVSAWDGVTSHAHRFGGTEFRLGKRELGHIHGDHLVDLPFPVRVREELVRKGEAETHHVLPESGWVSFRIREEADVSRALNLFKKSYGLALAQRSRREGRAKNVDLKGENDDNQYTNHE